jgi:hypothetical protein
MLYLIEQCLNGIQLGMLLFLLAAGLTLIFGIMDLVNLAHGSLYMIGAYFAATFAAWTGSFVLGALLALAPFEGPDVDARDVGICDRPRPGARRSEDQDDGLVGSADILPIGGLARPDIAGLLCRQGRDAGHARVHDQDPALQEHDVVDEGG